MNENQSPELIKLRDLFLQLAEGKTDKEKYSWVQEQIENETDELRKLALMSARVSILRSRSIGTEEQKVLNKVPEKKVPQKKNLPKKKTIKEQWHRVRILKSAEVNGVRFPSGSIVDVKAKDSKILISSKVAEIVNIDDMDNQTDHYQNEKS